MAAQSATLPRGFRNNNPLNLRISGIAWRGKIPVTQNTDGAFEQFDTMHNGIRAALINIRTCINKYHCDTPKLIIRRWAPDSDGNNSQHYCDTVCKLINSNPNRLVTFTNRKYVCRLVYGMIYVECGRTIELADILDAYDSI